MATTQKTAAAAKIEKKLCDAMAEMKTPPKTATVSYGKTKFAYAPLEAVMKEVKTCLAKHGLTLTQKSSLVTTEKGDTFFVLRTIVTDGKDVLVIDERPLSYAGKPQEIGSVETYYKRYALNTAFALAGEADMDGNVSDDVATSEEQQPKNLEDKINQLRQLYATCQKAGASKQELDGILNSFGKPVDQLNEEELTGLIALYVSLEDRINKLNNPNVMSME